jgi:hypothetical protein
MNVLKKAGKNNIVQGISLVVAAGLFILLTGVSPAAADNEKERQEKNQGKWMTGDFHTHTFLTDGVHTEADVFSHAFNVFGLNWIANSEHGGAYATNPDGIYWDDPSISPPTVFDGDPIMVSGHRAMWRWQSLQDYSFPLIQELRDEYKKKGIIQGVEWNCPSHEHASVGIVAEDAAPVSNFEYMFDQSDKDTSRAGEGLVKKNVTHADAVAGAQWLQDNYPETSYFLLNHPSRRLKYTIAHIRDFNNAAPDVFFGFEGIPGHQKESFRGGYSSGPFMDANNNDITYKARTYGGADYMIAKVGGLWDALLGEGRHFWTFVNSDFHSNAADADFWPGEYAKSYTFVTGGNSHKKDSNSLEEIVNGLRSGKTFAVHGDLINKLNFTAQSITKGRKTTASMGETLKVKKGDAIRITISFKSPKINNNGDEVKVDHVDLIAGNVTGPVAPGTPDYAKDTNETTSVIARFDEGFWEREKDEEEDDCYVINYKVSNVSTNMYFRLRGTNLAPNTTNETDAVGNPLVDTLMGTNDAGKAYQDLWFYSNPIFVEVKN